MTETKVPHWAKYSVSARDVDGTHTKFYQGWVAAQRQFRSQIGFDRDPKNYLVDKLPLDSQGNVPEPWKSKLETWTLEQHVKDAGYFEVVDDWGRVITIERIERTS